MSDLKMDRPKVGIGILVVRDGKILIGERISSHGSGTFQIPGGHLEFGETFEETAKREVEEETGLKNIAVQGVISVNNDIAYIEEGKHFVSVGVLAISNTGEPYDAEPLKSKNWKWYDPNNIPENMFSPSKKIIENWLNGTIYSD